MAAPGSGPAPGGRGDREELSGRWAFSDGERCGKPMENLWKTYGKPWKPVEKTRIEVSFDSDLTEIWSLIISTWADHRRTDCKHRGRLRH